MRVMPSAKPVKLFAISCVAGLVGVLLFILMQLLIAPAGYLKKNASEQTYLNFVRVDKNNEDLKTKKRQPPKEPPPPEAPPQTPQVSQEIAVANTQSMNISMPSLGMSINAGTGPFLGSLKQGQGLASFDTDVIPLVQVPPAYPRKAKLAKIQGYVTMEVTINPDGTVSHAQVTEAKPPRLFDAAAIAAIKRWKFRPKIVDGTPQAQRAKQTIEFKLNK